MATTKTTKEALLADLATVLGCKVQCVQVRLKALDMAEPCRRCGGSGSYSFNYMHGTTCYGCNGCGHQLPKLTPGLVAKARDAVASGKLQPYLDRIALRSKANRAIDAAMKAWTSTRVAKRYNKEWLDSRTKNPRLYGANNAMCSLYEEAGRLATRLQYGDRSKETRAYVKLSEQEGDDVARRLLAIPAAILALDYDVDSADNP